jgi:hypothetical protein
MPRRLLRPPDARAILITGVEGGGVTLYRRETTDGWEYYVEYVDQSRSCSTSLRSGATPASLAIGTRHSVSRLRREDMLARWRDRCEIES